MNKTININLAGIVFYVDEDAYKVLNDYLVKIKRQFGNTNEREEIIADIEARIAELFQQNLGSTKQVVNLADVEKIISIMGKPEDFYNEDEEAGPSDGSTYTGNTAFTPKKLYRNPDDKILGGVSSGLAAYFGIDSVWIRLAWVALFFGLGTGLLLYIVLWVVVPEAKTIAQKLQMSGEPININNIERKVKEEVRDIENRFNRFTEGGGFQKTGNKVKNIIQDIVQGILQIIRFIIRFIFKAIGIASMIAGVVVLMVIFSMILGFGTNINGVHLDWTNFTAYIETIMPNPTTYILMVIGIVMLALAPIIFLILLGMRILFNQPTKYKGFSLGLGILSGIGIFLIFLTATMLARSFAQQATYTETIDLSGGNAFALRVTDNIDDEQPYDLDWTITDRAQIIGLVKVDVKSTKGTKPYVELVMTSHGKDRLEARKRAKNYIYFIQQRDSMVDIGNYFTIPTDEKFRGQNLQVNMYLPVGYQVYLDESTIDVIYNVQNVSKTWDYDMVTHTWVMTENGLACKDCMDEKNEWRSDDEWQNFDEQFEEEAKNFDSDKRKRLEEAERQLKEAQKKLEELKNQK